MRIQGTWNVVESNFELPDKTKISSLEMLVYGESDEKSIEFTQETFLGGLDSILEHSYKTLTVLLKIPCEIKNGMLYVPFNISEKDTVTITVIGTRKGRNISYQTTKLKLQKGGAK